jgi:hypothetical protein
MILSFLPLRLSSIFDFATNILSRMSQYSLDVYTRPSSRWEPSCCGSQACPGCSPLTVTHALWAAKVGRDFPSAKVALSLVCGGEAQCDPAASPRQTCVRREISSLECLKSAYRCIGQAHPRRSSELDFGVSLPLHLPAAEPSRAPAATSRLVWPARSSLRCLRFQRRLILTAGSCRWTSKLLHAPDGPVGSSPSITKTPL